MAQSVKDLALSVQWLQSLLLRRFNLWPWELPHAMGMGEKKGNITLLLSYDLSDIDHILFKSNFYYLLSKLLGKTYVPIELKNCRSFKSKIFGIKWR